jgi:hypothetical protein
MPSEDVAAAVLEESLRNLRYYRKLADAALAQVRDADFFRSPDAESNSIAVIVKHLAGNMRSRFARFLESDGEKPDRRRDQEFEIAPSTSREELMKAWEDGWKTVLEAVTPLGPPDVMRSVTIRGEPHSVLQAISRQVAHYAHHIGQIVFLAKHWCGASWESLSIPRGKSEEFNRQPPGDRRHL